MRFSCDWLHDFLETPLPAPAALSARLTAAGFETGTWEEITSPATSGSPAPGSGSLPDLPPAEVRRRIEGRLPLVGSAQAGHADLVLGPDVALEVDITANRPDAMNHFGLAREIAAALGASLRAQEIDLVEDAAPASSRASIAIEAPDLCPRYVGRVVTGLRVAPSPAWLRRRLEAIGLTPKNNLVDASNYVLFELGQPLHAFDLARLTGNGVVVRRSRAGETMVTVVDRVETKLAEGMLVIAEAGSGARPGRPAAIAGVMGGFDTAISDATTDVLVESAWFDPRSVARTSRALGLRTDASQRFERGADPGMTLFAADRLATMLAELGGGRVLSGAIDIRAPGSLPPGSLPMASPGAPSPVAGRDSSGARRGFTPQHRPEPIVLRTARAAGYLGVAVTADEAASRLARLSIAAEPAGGGASLRCRIPTWRGDVTLEVDLIEEIARIGGYEAIPATLPAIPPPVPREGAGEAEDRARRALAGFGYREVITYAMVSRGDDRLFGSLRSPGAPPDTASPLVIANPLSERWEVMRRSLLPGLSGALAFNLARGREDLRLFEVASVHGAGDPPYEARAVAVGGAGLAHDPAAPRPQRPYDLLDLSGALESLAASLGAGRTDLSFAPPGASAGAWPFHPAQSFLVMRGGEPIGRGGRLSADVETAIESDRPLFLAEMSLEPFLDAPSPPRFRPLPRLNPVSRDLSFFVTRATAYARIEEAMAEAVRRTTGGPAGAPSYTLIDRFEGKSVPDGRVSYAFRFRFAPRERALTTEEINGAVEAIADHLTKELQAEIRSR